MSYEVRAVRLPGIGSKRVCVSCATRFYDLAKMPPVCPKCGAEQPPEVPRPPPMRRSPARSRMMKAPAPAARDPDDDAAPVLDADEDEIDSDDEVDAAEEEAEEEPEAEAGIDEPER